LPERRVAGRGRSDAIPAKAAWQEALKAMREAQVTVVPVIKAYRNWLLATYGDAPGVLADYRVAPRKKPAPLTTDQQAAALAKREATRAARHTMGPKQRKQVKGTVPVTTTPPAAPPPPVAVPAPKPVS
jgi:hypothetical protein